MSKGPGTDLQPAIEAGAVHGLAMDAVETAVRVLEDDPSLNAGYGSVLHRDGGIELDAGIVDGATGRWAGVGAVSVANPISLARLVLEQTPHVLLAGPGADDLARRHGLRSLDRSAPEQHARWKRAAEEGVFDAGDFGRPDHVDTVGAVALDPSGRIAAGSSTGGVFGNLRGRIGDAPVFGAGLYADERLGVLGTGVGELFLETLACLNVGRLVREGAPVQEACEESIATIVEHGLRDAPGRPGAKRAAGLLALDAHGNLGAAFSGASWQVQGPDGPVQAADI